MMTKTMLLRHSLCVVLFFFFFSVQIDRSESIRCGNQCPFIYTSFNFTLTPQVCPKIVENEKGQCSVVLDLDFVGVGGGGLLMMQEKTAPDELRIETKFGLRSNITSTTLFYTCTSGDNCAFEFAREIFGSVLARFDLLKIQKDLRDILYIDNPPSDKVECANQQCDGNRFCQGQVIETLSPTSTSIQLKNQFDCVTSDDKTDLLFVVQSYSYPSTIKSNLTVICNEPACNSDLNLRQVYTYFNTTFRFPANFSVMSIDPSPSPPSSSNSFDLHWKTIFVTLALFQCLLV